MSNVKRKRASRRVVDANNARIGFVGAGQLASALICGLVAFGKVDPRRVVVAAPSPNNTDQLKQLYRGLRTTKRNIDIFGRYDCDIVFLAVNGNVIQNLYKLGGTRPAPLTTNYIPNMRHQLYIVSLITGFKVTQIKECLLNPEHPEKYMLEMHRVVLNCAVAYAMGVGCIDVDPDSQNLGDPLRQLLSLVAKLDYLPESQMDAACALCGAGLSYCYYFINAMSDGALKIGLSRAFSVKLCSKVAGIAGQSLLETGLNPNELKDQTCGPSGGAIYGISVLDKAEVSSGLSAAVEAAYKRALSMATEAPIGGGGGGGGGVQMNNFR